MAEVARRPKKKGPQVTRVIATRDRNRLELLIAGDLKVEDLDDEEIQRMQLKNMNGDFRGRPPLWIPRSMALEFRAEFNRRFQAELQAMVPEALRAHKELLTSRHLAPGDAARMTAVKEVYDRAVGKVVQQTEVHAVVENKTFEDFVGDAIIDVELEDD